ncbi:hypothetical protein EX895_002628 [Sporisorium graminicola]|uniref:Uncharacterized protein n=1 Tax=Sporisorium graminicola TaxID=280036 RepID=A0A4U7KVQ6_9BASI|nr:hypothetical protein EX895_002628 [Sporisorium graminicola]TKY88276.1 hypothetical protein EX895_002628 [Sporisorium graminicola]
MLQTFPDTAQATNQVQRFTVPAMPFSHPSLASSTTSTVFAPISIEIPPFASLEVTTKAVGDSYALARQFSVDAQDDYVKTLLKLFNSVRPETSVPTFSSLGQLGPLDGLRSYQVASRNNLPSLGIHAWTLNNQLNLSLAWCPGRFNSEIVDSFWSNWINALEQLSL